jgi:hypothetical protein
LVSRTGAFVDDSDITHPAACDFPAEVALQLGNLRLAGLAQTVRIDNHARVAAVYLPVVQPSKRKPALMRCTAEP